MNAGTVIFRTDLDTSGLEKGISKASQSISNLGKKMTTALTAPIGAFITGGVMYNAQLEQYQAGLTTLLGSSEKAVETMTYLKKMAAKTPFETADLIKGTQTMLAFGMSIDETKTALNMIGDVAMGNKDKFNSLTLAFAQVQATGRLMGQDMLQMVNQGFNPLQIMAEKTGRSMADLKQDMEDGLISAEMVTEAFKIATSEGGRFYKGMSIQAETLSGKLSTLKDDFMTMTGTLTASLLPAITKIVDKASTLLQWFSGLDAGTQQTILKMLGAAAAMGPLLIGLGAGVNYLNKFNGVLSKVPSAIGNTSKSFLDGSKRALTFAGSLGTKTTGAISNFINKVPLVNKLPNIIGGALSSMGDKISGFTAPFGMLIEFMFGGIAEKISTVFSKIGKIGMAGLDKLKSLVGIAFKLVGPFAIIGFVLAGLGLAEKMFGDQLDTFIKIAITKGPQLLSQFFNKITEQLPMIIKLGVDLLLKLVDVIIANAPILINGAVAIVTGLALGVSKNIDKIIKAVIDLLDMLIIVIINNLPIILDAGLKILLALINGIVNNIDKIVNSIVDIIVVMILVISDNLPMLIDAGIKILVALAKGLAIAIPKIIETIPTIVKAIFKAFKETDWGKIGKSIIDGIVAGLSAAGSLLVDSLKKIGEMALKGFKKLFGIKSPSRVFADEVGKFIPAGIAVGITANSKSIDDAVADLGLSTNMSSRLNTTFSPSVINNINVNMEQDPLGRIVNQAKTFGNGSRLGYAYNGGMK